MEGVSWEGTVVVTLLHEAPQPLVGPALLTGLLSVGLASWFPEAGHRAPEERVSVTGGGREELTRWAGTDFSWSQ